MRVFHFILFLSLIFLTVPSQAAPFLPAKSLTTASGIPVWYIEDHSAPIIALSFGFIGAGSTNDPAEKQGLAQMLASTLDEGAGPYDSRAFQEQLENNAISLSFSASRDYFTGGLKTLSSSKETAFRLLSLSLTKPHFTNDALFRMKEAHRSMLLENKTDPDWQAARLMNDRIFEGSVYARNSGGTLSGLSAVTRGDLVQFQKSYLTRARLKVAVVGDLSAKDISLIVDQIFGSLPHGDAPEKPAKADQISLKNAGKTFLYVQNIPQTLMIKVQPAPRHDDPDEAAFTVMNYIWGGGGFGSRLMDKIREQAGLTYGIYSGLSHLTHCSYLTVHTSTRNDRLSQMDSLILTESDRFIKTGPTEPEISDAKGYLLGSMAAALTSTDKIADLMAAQMLQDRPIDDLDRQRAAIQAVTGDDVKKAAQKWIKMDQATTILVGSPPEISSMIRIKTLPNVE